MKNKFISRLLSLVAIMVLLYSCRNELTPEQETYNNSSQFRPTSKTIRLEQSKHKLALKTELQKAQDNLQEIKTNASGKSVDYANGVSIDTDNVTYIESGPTFHTYTFNLVRENAPENAPLENLVLASLPDGSYKELLVTYNFTSQEKKDLLAGKGVKTAGKTTAIELAKGTYGGVISNRSMGGSESCSYQTVDMYFSCYTGEHHQGNESSWGSCNWQNQGGYPAQHLTVVALVCTASTALGDDGSPGGGELGPTTGLGSGPNDGTPTTPTLSTFFMYVKKLPTDLKTIIYDTANTEFYDGLKKFYDFNNSQLSQDLIKWGLQFKQNNAITWGDFQPMLTYAYNFLEQNPDTVNPEQIFTRIQDLDNALVQNPNLLLNIPCSELPKWQNLANHPIPTSIKNRIFQINGQTNWFSDAVIQNLDYSSSFTINMDVYPIKISNMPEKAPGIKYTHAEFFDYFRKNINNFTSISHGKFYPVVEPQFGIDDTQLWNSENPLGSLITIKIPADNGTVVCSGFDSQAWIFTTVKSPWDGEHPVSGNRLFGYFIDSSGDMVIYTRGVDRFTTKVSNNALQYTVESFGYSEAKKMWQTMQQKLSSFVNSKNGTSSIIPGVDYTPNYIFVKDYLRGNKSLTALGCH
ncbi:hypothetical protein [Chryseobacterium sp. MA9]|uniref:hypothetical protein n=1 Tax=Chryseobacterium sp. MA9 TaxID=2966625 RepID=UPI002104ED45|nr:hypothetical protein [Chryseobacterium sp. MA9]UTX47164.1 hypothetical protein KIK00_14535 [Chryseobacterium sp. MA9]